MPDDAAEWSKDHDAEEWLKNHDAAEWSQDHDAEEWLKNHDAAEWSQDHHSSASSAGIAAICNEWLGLPRWGAFQRRVEDSAHPAAKGGG